MKPYKHCQISAKNFGGKPDDYLKIHNWFDQTKSTIADVRHRMILHNALGIFICEQVFGIYFTNSDGKIVQVRDVAEQHVLDDLGTIPSVDKCFASMKIEQWMGGPIKNKKIYSEEQIINKIENYDKEKSEDLLEKEIFLDSSQEIFEDGSELQEDASTTIMQKKHMAKYFD